MGILDLAIGKVPLSTRILHPREGKKIQVKRAFKKSDEDGGLPYKPRKPKTPFVRRPRLPESKPHVTSPTFPTTPTPIVPWLLWPFHHGMNYSIQSMMLSNGFRNRFVPYTIPSTP